ncbi:MAG: hypothetical protein M3401_18005 [Actinomycetota bacterium]|nr:hypothetical protein [Actinomycetota bacterium]
MRKRTLGVALTSMAVAGAAIPTVADSASAPSKPKIKVLGGTSFVPNRYVKDKMRFNKDVYPVKSGSTVTLTDESEDIHTLSIVRRSDLPKTVSGFDKCFESGICGQLFGAHGFPEGEGPPTTPLVNKGKAGLNTRGDSVVLAPSDKATFKVTAAKGRSLLFMCIIHPWMQAKFSVK